MVLGKRGDDRQSGGGMSVKNTEIADPVSSEPWFDYGALLHHTSHQRLIEVLESFTHSLPLSPVSEGDVLLNPADSIDRNKNTC